LNGFVLGRSAPDPKLYFLMSDAAVYVSGCIITSVDNFENIHLFHILPTKSSANMSNLEEYKLMSFEGSEKESFIPSISSILAKRRRIGEKFPLLGWIISLILALIILYGKIYPPNPTDLQCDRQLNAWCEYLYLHGISLREMQQLSKEE